MVMLLDGNKIAKLGNYCGRYLSPFDWNSCLILLEADSESNPETRSPSYIFLQLLTLSQPLTCSPSSPYLIKPSISPNKQLQAKAHTHISSSNMPCDHFALHVPASKLEGVVSFLLTSLSHLSFQEFARPFPGLVGLGDGTPYLWLSAVPEDDAGMGLALEKLMSEFATHIAFRAEKPEDVREFHRKAIKAGGKDNGAPGLRPQFGPNYYAAFVKDPACGINFEVICRNGDV